MKTKRLSPASWLAAAVASALLLTGATPQAAAESIDGKKILVEKCVSCHQIEPPAVNSVEKLRDRKGPDLFYAGIKYNRPWLESWLVKPVRLRPAGYRYWLNIKPVAGKSDEIDKSKLEEHLSVSADEAKAIADALMSMKANEDAVTKNALTPEKLDMMMAEMNFEKFSGCLACHQIEPDFGGFTGPEVYTIADRLQPDFIYSYLKSPQKFDPRTTMPDKLLGEKFLQDLSKYMIELGKGK